MKRLMPFVIPFIVAAWLFGCGDDSDTVGTEGATGPTAQQPLISPDNPKSTGAPPPATVPLRPLAPAAPAALSSTSATLTPSEITATLRAGESIEEHKTLFLPKDVRPPKGDILFALDLTGSMGGELNNAKANSINIMNAIRGLIPDSHFGVVSHMDYVGYFSGCGYAATYGGPGDYPYRLDQPLTGDTTDVAGAINALVLGWGADAPENYTRVLYESYSDPAIVCRSGAKRILVFWHDDLPHDCDVDFGRVRWSDTVSTGPDPGRDGIVGTADDLNLAVVLGEMAAQNVVLIALHSGWYLDLWQYYAGITGGDAFPINPAGTVPGGIDIATYIASLIQQIVAEINHLTLKVKDPAYAGWLVSVSPPSYGPITLDADQYFDFDIEIRVPAGTPDGIYEFEIVAVGDGVEYASQLVTITVRNEIDVAVDILPTSCPNPLNVRSGGVLPVAIVGTPDFDVRQVDPASVELEGVSAIRWDLEDVTSPYFGPLVRRDDCTTEGPDFILDLTLKFDQRAIVGALGFVNDGDVLVLTLTGNLKPEFGGTPIKGQDVVWILNKGR